MKNKRKLLYLILPIIIISLFIIVIPTTSYISRLIRSNNEEGNIDPSGTISNSQDESLVVTTPETIDNSCGIFSKDGSLLYSWDFLLNSKYISVSEDGCLSTYDVLNKDDSLSNINLNGTLVISNDVTSLTDNSFYNWAGITSLYITDNVTSIGANSFAYCTSLSSVYYKGDIDVWYNMQCPIFRYSLNENHLYLYNDDELEYQEVKEVIIPKNMTSILKFQFCGYNNIEVFKAYNNIKFIEFEALLRCDKLQSIILPFSGYDLQGFDNKHFGYIFGAKVPTSNQQFVPQSLETIIINDQEMIGDKAFLGLNNIKYVTLNKVINIKENAFDSCTSLNYIVLDSSLKYIGNNAFASCTIETIFFKGSEYEWERQIVYANNYSHPDYFFDEYDKFILRSDDVYLYSKERPQSPFIVTDYWYYNEEDIPTIWS